MRTHEDDPLAEEERRLFALMRELQDRHREELQPYVDALIRIASLRPTPPMVIAWGELRAAGLLPGY